MIRPATRYACRAFCTLLLLLAFAQRARAAVISQASQFLNNAGTTLNFTEVVLAMNTSVTNQYAAYGVNFTSAYYSPATGYPNMGSANIGNFIQYVPYSPNFAIYFTQNQVAADFAMASQSGTATITALLNGTTVETFSAPSGQSATADIYGFTGITFNEIAVSMSSSDHALLLSQLQYNVVLPEPGLPCTVAFLLLLSIACTRVRLTQGIS